MAIVSAVFARLILQTNGFFYVPLYPDYTAAQPQMYVNGNWISISAVVYDGTSTKDVLGFKFSPPGASPDVNPDLEPSRPDKPPLNPGTCTHEWQLSSTVELYCETAGKKVYICPACEGTKEEVIAALEHIYIETSRIPATCTATGSVTYTCTRCNKTKIDGILVLGHDYIEQNRVAATCEDETKSEHLATLDHVYTETSHTPAICDKDGSVVSTCSRCGDAVTGLLPVLGTEHTWEETERIAVTDTAPGSVKYTCSVCGVFKTERIPSLGADLTMSGFLANISEVFSSVVEWIQIVSDVISTNPVLLICVVLAFIGTGAALLRRLLKAGG